MSGRFPVHELPSGWRIAPDQPPPAAGYVQQVLAMNLIDEITGLPPDPPPAASTATSGLTALAAADGLAGLSGRPLERYPTALSNGATLQISLTSPFYVAMSLTAAINLPSAYPAAFAATSLGEIALHRAPVVIEGRVVDAEGDGLSAATVTVVGLWPTVASMQNSAPAPANILACLSPLYAARDATATVAATSLAAVAPAKTLVQPGNVGQASLRLSDQLGLTIGDILALDAQDPGRVEHVAITAITDVGVTPQGAVTVAFSFPLARFHAAGGVATPMTVAASGPTNNLASAAQVGDVTLFPVAMAGLDSSLATIVVSGGGPADSEIHAAGLYSATSDAFGNFVLPPLHRLAQAQLFVHHPPQTDLQSNVILPLGATVLTLDLAMT